MALTVGVDTYLSLSDFKAWLDKINRPYASFSDAEIEAALTISSIHYIDTTYKFKGEKLDENQAMRLPTDEVSIADITNGAAQAAWQQLKGLLFVDQSTQSVNGKVTSESKSVGSLSKSVDYEEGTALSTTYNTTQITNFLKPYLAVGSGSFDSLRVL